MNLRLKSTDLGCEGLWHLGNTGLSDIQVTNRTWKEEFFQLFFTAVPVCLDESCRSPAPGWTSCCGAAGLPVWRAGRIPEQFYRNQKCSTGSCWWSPQRGTGKKKGERNEKNTRSNGNVKTAITHCFISKLIWQVLGKIFTERKQRIEMRFQHNQRSVRTIFPCPISDPIIAQCQLCLVCSVTGFQVTHQFHINRTWLQWQKAVSVVCEPEQ